MCRSDVDVTPEDVAESLAKRGLGPRPLHTRSIAAHLERHAGRYEIAICDQIADGLPIDILVTPQSPKRRYKLLMTSGMSDRRMCPPARTGKAPCRAELAFLLPPDWRLTRHARRNPRWFWPLKVLFDLADYVHRRNAWLWCNHTLENAGERLGPGAPFDSLLLHHSSVLGDEFSELPLPSGERVHVLSVWPLHPAEIRHALSVGLQDLVERLVAAGVTDRLDVERASVIG